MIKQMILDAEPLTPMMVPLADLIRELDGSIDACYWDGRDWFEQIAMDKAGDPSMGDLLNSILENGLTVPLNVISYSDDTVIMGNGHHRLILAALCGIETIGVYRSEEGIDWSISSIGSESCFVCIPEDTSAVYQAVEAWFEDSEEY